MPPKLFLTVKNMDQDVAQLAAILKTSLKEFLQGKNSPKELFGVTSNEINILAAKACEMAEQGKTADAQSLLEGLVVLDPENVYLHNCLGTLYMRLELTKLAIGEFLFVLRHTPHDTTANTNLGELYFEQGDIESAVKYLGKAVEFDPEEKDLFANRARAILLLLADISKEVQERGSEALEEIKERIAKM
ncbi:MAG: tetratricopeptide repeat protein [Blastocatellia bacterium]|nr:tetratricopeptide repeat protein [Blastocatellia bacterium]